VWYGPALLEDGDEEPVGRGRKSEAGQAVYYEMTPTYSGRRTVPIGFRISAYGTNPDGSTGIQIDAFVSNTLAGRNLGMFNDPKTGRQVPVGGTP
jgi:hypothetical protein